MSTGVVCSTAVYTIHATSGWELPSSCQNCVLFHPPYLDISPSLAHMLDHIVITYVYVEKLSKELHYGASELGIEESQFKSTDHDSLMWIIRPEEDDSYTTTSGQLDRRHAPHIQYLRLLEHRHIRRARSPAVHYFDTRASKKITTVTKYRWSGEHSVAETMGVIEWHKVKNTLIRFNGRELEADVMLKKRAWSTGRYFEGPDKRFYKWKLGPGYCWLKPADSNAELAKFHKKTLRLGMLKQSQPPFIDARVSTSATHMMDHIIVTYVYAEKVRHDRAQLSG
ncbi:hypothetical protein BU15DRAFT_81673 [Melanogaster broomeanus]|nr:hypothetical protein BU15DRAFT_81673 [Melanogaster broomeanus]